MYVIICALFRCDIAHFYHFPLGEGDLRLVHPISGRGRLEIFLREEWGTVCSNGFGLPEADIACRQLGYYFAATYGTVDQLG